MDEVPIKEIDSLRSSINGGAFRQSLKERVISKLRRAAITMVTAGLALQLLGGISNARSQPLTEDNISAVSDEISDRFDKLVENIAETIIQARKLKGALKLKKLDEANKKVEILIPVVERLQEYDLMAKVIGLQHWILDELKNLDKEENSVKKQATAEINAGMREEKGKLCYVVVSKSKDKEFSINSAIKQLRTVVKDKDAKYYINTENHGEEFQTVIIAPLQK